MLRIGPDVISDTISESLIGWKAADGITMKPSLQSKVMYFRSIGLLWEPAFVRKLAVFLLFLFP